MVDSEQLPPADGEESSFWKNLGGLLATGGGIYGQYLAADVQKTQAELSNANALRAQELGQQNYLARLTGTDNAGKWVAYAVIGAFGLVLLLKQARK